MPCRRQSSIRVAAARIEAGGSLAVPAVASAKTAAWLIPAAARAERFTVCSGAGISSTSRSGAPVTAKEKCRATVSSRSRICSGEKWARGWLRRWISSTWRSRSKQEPSRASSRRSRARRDSLRASQPPSRSRARQGKWIAIDSGRGIGSPLVPAAASRSAASPIRVEKGALGRKHGQPGRSRSCHGICSGAGGPEGKEALTASRQGNAAGPHGLRARLHACSTQVFRYWK